MRGCFHMPGFVIACGYDEQLALASVGPGWAELVREGLAIVAGRGRLVQVKEKYGTLCLYAESDAESGDMFDLLWAIEARSAQICEKCGEPGKIVGAGWYRTACPVHTAGDAS